MRPGNTMLRPHSFCRRPPAPLLSGCAMAPPAGRSVWRCRRRARISRRSSKTMKQPAAALPAGRPAALRRPGRDRQRRRQRRSGTALGAGVGAALGSVGGAVGAGAAIGAGATGLLAGSAMGAAMPRRPAAMPRPATMFRSITSAWHQAHGAKRADRYAGYPGPYYPGMPRATRTPTRDIRMLLAQAWRSASGAASAAAASTVSIATGSRLGARIQDIRPRSSWRSPRPKRRPGSAR